MIRPLTLLCLVAAAGAGLHVYNTKHAVSLLDRELRGIGAAIEEAEARTRALHAEWAWATEQDRLRALAQRHLALEPMQPTQFVRFAEAERRLPAPVAYEGPVALFAPRESAPANGRTSVALLAPGAAAPAPPAAAVPPALSAPTLAAVAQAALAAAEAPLPLPAPAAPEARPVTARASVALAVPPPAARPASEHRTAEARAPEPASRPAGAEATRTPPPPRPVPAPRPAPEVAAPPPIAAPAARAPASVPRAPVQQVATVPIPRSPPVAAPVQQVAAASPPPPPRIAEPAAASLGSFGSALGGSRSSLPPPVAFGSAHAAPAGASFR